MWVRRPWGRVCVARGGRTFFLSVEKREWAHTEGERRAAARPLSLIPLFPTHATHAALGAARAGPVPRGRGTLRPVPSTT